MGIETEDHLIMSEEVLRDSELRYRRLFESACDGILILDADTRKITDVNPFMIELLGYTKSEFLGKELWEIGLLKDEESSIAAFEELRNNGYIRYDDLPLKTKNGEIREVEFVSNVYFEADRQVIQCNIRDVTGRIGVDTEIRLMKRSIDSIIEGILICDAQRPDHPIIYTNAAFEHSTGYRFEEVEGRNCRFLQGAETDRLTINKIREALQEERPFRGEVLNYHKDGTSFWNELKISPIFDKSNNLTHFVGVLKDVTDRKMSEDSLNSAEARFRNLVESSPGIVYLIEPNPPYLTLYISPNIQSYGYSPEEWLAKPAMWLNIVHHHDRARVMSEYETAWEQGLETDLEYRITAQDGAIYWWHDKGRFVLDAQGNRTGWQGIILDITATKQLEEQLRQAQKLESVGLLAGGIAHDFNNMLTAINGYSDLTLHLLKEGDPLRNYIGEIKNAGLRSADLTRQLLAFSRQQVLQPKVLDLNEVIAETIKMLQRLIGEDIQLTTTLSPKLGRIKVDPGQFPQVIMNLVVNARDAMPQGGKLTIETANVSLESTYSQKHIGILPGDYVVLTVSDTGTGMNAETQRHLFEPFFTTKEIGRGTGLGLATVYGIIKQSGGSIEVDSEFGSGTTFKIYLPHVVGKIEMPKEKSTVAELPTGTDTILLVEDEEIVRDLSREILELCGYTVVAARNGAEALKICDSGDYKFDLLMTDVVMPEMGGRELAEKLTIRFPGLKILFTSGYTDDAVVRHGVIESNTNFIQKPFSLDSLAIKIREVLDNSN